jgi:uncharacterized protein (TIGR03437 family)
MKLLWCGVLIMNVAGWAQVSPTINDVPSRQFGQAKMLNSSTLGTPNLVEGRELNRPASVAFSASGDVMYVADSNNNRVLAWRSPSSLTKGNQADKVIGQRDFYSTAQKGPGTDLTSGLSAPIGVAVDRAGNLYVLDAGNNRILRYPNPFTQTTDPLSVDLVIGQKTQSSCNLPNANDTCSGSMPKPTNTRLAFSSGGSVLQTGLTFDAQGNLWVADAGNNRVLRFPSSVLTAGRVDPAADSFPIGQSDFQSNTAASCTSRDDQLKTTGLLQPQSVAFDAAGALYIADSCARVLYYPNPNTQNTATVVLGVVPPPPAPPQQSEPVPSEFSLSNASPGRLLAVFTDKNSTGVFVADTSANRVVRYASPAQFSTSASTPSPASVGVIGQPDLLSGNANRGLAEPSATSLLAPIAGGFDAAGNLWIVDAGNNRVLSYPAASNSIYNSATIVVGQTDFPFNAPNLIEGREIWIYTASGVPGGGIVVDKSSNPPHLYIADTFNNRVLGFRDARAVGSDARSILTQKADLVIGQRANDFSRAVVNYPGGDQRLPTATGLLRPVGLAVDGNGNLWVADSGNGRVLRFPAPFDHQGDQTATLVLGQSDFQNKDQSPTAQNMNTPWGVALFPDGGLAVSDAFLNRVMIFSKPPFSNGQPASSIVGQKDSSSSGPSSTLAGLNLPRNIATDTSGRLYVCDSGNNRVLVYTPGNFPTGATAAFNFPNFSQPQGIAVSAATGEMWVTAGNTLFHLPEVTSYQNTSTIFQQIQSNLPLEVALDAFDNPIVAEASNRITFYFAKLAARNAFTFTSTRPLTPGMWIQAAPVGKILDVPDEVHETPPYPSTVAGLQMLVNGAPAGIYAVIAKTYINFVIPWSAPSSGTAEFLLFNPATKEIVAAGTFLMSLADPAFKTVNGAGTGQILAANVDDGGLNGPQNPVSRGKVLTLALTGQGLVSNPPADGFPPTGLVPTPQLPVVTLGAVNIPPENILFSGLDPTYPGSWTINIRIPETAQGGPAPGNNIPIFVRMYDIPSNWGFDPSNSNNDILLTVPNARITTIAVK